MRLLRVDIFQVWLWIQIPIWFSVHYTIIHTYTADVFIYILIPSIEKWKWHLHNKLHFSRLLLQWCRYFTSSNVWIKNESRWLSAKDDQFFFYLVLLDSFSSNCYVGIKCFWWGENDMCYFFINFFRSIKPDHVANTFELKLITLCSSSSMSM